MDFNNKMDYKSAGVDIKLGEKASNILYEASKKTWKNRQGKIGQIMEIGHGYKSVRYYSIGCLPQDTVSNIGFDGIGTKVEVAERLAMHSTVGIDLMAMVCDDAVSLGAEPIVVGSVLDVRSLGESEPYLNFVHDLAEGYIIGAKQAGVAVSNGECAELRYRINGYGRFNYNWCAGVVWIAKKDRLITGEKIRTGDSIVALKEQGFRSNGLSLVNNILSAAYGDDWHTLTYDKQNLAELVLRPSKIYTKAILDLTGGYDNEPKADVHGIVHVTGGGIPQKLGALLKSVNLGADIFNPFLPSGIMIHCHYLGHFDDKEAFSTWNMGHGMLVITPDSKPVLNVLGKHLIDAKVVGAIIDKPVIKIANAGVMMKPNSLEFPL